MTQNTDLNDLDQAALDDAMKDMEDVLVEESEAEEHVEDAEIHAFYGNQGAENAENTDTPSNADAHAVLTALQAENIELKDKVLRALAEAENTRRRAEKDKEDTRKFSISNFAKSLLPVLDNFRRALDSVTEEQKQENEVLSNLMIGIEATERELLKAFEQNKIEKIEPVGQQFDPNVHEVLFEMDAAGQEPGTVMQVVETGYKINDRLLRPARVGIAKGDATTSSVDTVA